MLSNALEKLVQIWKIKDLRNKLFFILLMLFVFRLAANIPIPGVNSEVLKNLFQSNQMLSLLNLFSGGGMSRFSIVMMGVSPYITSSIIFQLLSMIIPSLEEMQKDESGRQKINMWTRWFTFPLSMLQSYGMITILKKTAPNIIDNVDSFHLFSVILIVSAGTIFLMWIGELITEKKFGNGISLLIFAGIVSGVPQAIQQMFLTFDKSNILTLIFFVGVAIVTTIGVVIISEGQRNIPIQYARQVKGRDVVGNSHLPLRVNIAGVMPIIFAISIVMFPPMLAQFFVNAKTAWLAIFASKIIALFNNQIFYAFIYFLLVFGFTFFYTEIIFKPDQIAENLQRQGGFIPGIRPGQATVQYLSNTIYKIVLAGALFLGLIAILPLIIKYFTGMQFLAIGGTSLLIVVSVVIETVKQIESQLTMRNYEK